MKYIKSIILISCLIANLVFLYFYVGFSILNLFLAFVIFCLSFILQGALHEVGHFIGGTLSGYKLVVLQIGRANLTCSRSGEYNLIIKKTRGGQCIMLPPMIEPVRYIAYNIGGIIMNLIITMLSGFLLLIDSNIARLVFIELVFSGLFKIIANSVPNIVNGIPTDGYILNLLKNKPLIQNDYLNYLSLYAALSWNEDINVEKYTYTRCENNIDNLLYYNGIKDLLDDIKPKQNNDL